MFEDLHEGILEIFSERASGQQELIEADALLHTFGVDSRLADTRDTPTTQWMRAQGHRWSSRPKPAPKPAKAPRGPALTQEQEVARRREQRMLETPEQRQRRLAKQRDYYVLHKHEQRETRNARQREYDRKKKASTSP